MFVDPLLTSAHISYPSFVLHPSTSTSTFRLFHSSSFNVLFRFHVSPFVSLPRRSSLSHSLVSTFVPRRAFRLSPFAFRPNLISIPFPFRRLSLISPARIFASLAKLSLANLISVVRPPFALNPNAYMHALTRYMHT